MRMGFGKTWSRKNHQILTQENFCLTLWTVLMQFNEGVELLSDLLLILILHSFVFIYSLIPLDTSHVPWGPKHVWFIFGMSSSFHSHELGSWQIFLHMWLLNWVSCRHATYFFETFFYFSKQISCKWFLSSWKIMGKSAWLRFMD